MKFIDTMIEKRNLRKMNHIKTEKFGISTILKFVTVTALVLYAFSLFLPFIWLIINSWKDEIRDGTQVIEMKEYNFKFDHQATKQRIGCKTEV